jgi:hypothetical protein
MKLSILALVSILASGVNAQVANPCLVCQHGATASDDFAPLAEYNGDPATWKSLIDLYNLIEKESGQCEWGQFIAGLCCSTTCENPCIMCADGATAGNEFAP